MEKISDIDFKILRKKFKKKNKEKIEISVFCASRNRADFLKTSIINLYGLANNPKRIEYLLRIDYDDKETIDLVLNDKDLKIFKKLRCFIGHRVGYKYIYKVWAQLMKLSIGNVFLPFADDCVMALKGWDDVLYPYKDKDAVINFNNKRIAFTKIAYNKHKVISEWAGRTERADSVICKYAISNNIYVKEKNIWDRHQPNDQLFKESHGGWELKDLSILEDLSLVELNRYV